MISVVPAAPLSVFDVPMSALTTSFVTIVLESDTVIVRDAETPKNAPVITVVPAEVGTSPRHRVETHKVENEATDVTEEVKSTRV